MALENDLWQMGGAQKRLRRREVSEHPLIGSRQPLLEAGHGL